MGDARTLAMSDRGWTVTWNDRSCPHYRADRVLAGFEA